MAYDKQTWDTNSFVNPTRMNHIENGIKENSDEVGVLKQNIADLKDYKEYQISVYDNVNVAPFNAYNYLSIKDDIEQYGKPISWSVFTNSGSNPCCCCLLDDALRVYAARAATLKVIVKFQKLN